MRRLLSKICRIILGRKQLSRLGRFLLNAGRMDGDNEQDTNGEFLYLRKMVEAALIEKGHAIVFDIGANKGIVTKYAADLLDGKGTVFAAEPCSETFETMKNATSNLRTKVIPIRAAFSDCDGTGTLQVVGANAGTNSLVASTTQSSSTESVSLMRLDSYAYANQLESIDFLKVDTEGHDYSVLRGCEKLLAANSIAAIQFEYNWRWIGQRSYLKDVFDFTSAFGSYRIGKVTNLGIELYDQWSPLLETLIENNYAIVREDRLERLSLIKPWFS